MFESLWRCGLIPKRRVITPRCPTLDSDRTHVILQPSSSKILNAHIDRCFGSTEFIPVKCQCLENRGIFWHPHPDGCHWLFNHAEHCEFVETFIPQVQLSSRAAVIGSPVDENIQDMISDMHEEAARLQEANEKVLTELRHVEFENSFSSAMMIQNMKSFQDRQTQSNLKFMKDMEDRLRVYEHQQKLPIQHMEKEVLELRHEIKDTRRLPMNQVVDLPALEEYIRSEVVKAILQLTPSNNQENSQ